MTTVAVIGLGAMGSRMARRLIDAGYEVVVWNRTRSRTAEVSALALESPAAAARRAEAVITSVTGPEALRDVTEGPEGVLAGADGATLIEMSTVGPAAIARLAALVQAPNALLEAPVLGSRPEAEAGTLRIFAGGPDELVERWRPLLERLGTVLHVGPLGAGAAAKLVANATLVGTITLLGETVALADGLGLLRTETYEILAATPLEAVAERRREALESDGLPTRFALSLARKDAELIAESAETAGLDLRVLEAARSWLAEADDAGWGDRDYAAVLRRIVHEP
jgi:3-hydroxyisobutyrate dehydrogenase/2-hydroxy-3-oxopropionate reductase